MHENMFFQRYIFAIKYGTIEVSFQHAADILLMLCFITWQQVRITDSHLTKKAVHEIEEIDGLSREVFTDETLLEMTM